MTSAAPQAPLKEKDMFTNTRIPLRLIIQSVCFTRLSDAVFAVFLLCGFGSMRDERRYVFGGPNWLLESERSWKLRLCDRVFPSLLAVCACDLSRVLSVSVLGDTAMPSVLLCDCASVHIRVISIWRVINPEL